MRTNSLALALAIAVAACTGPVDDPGGDRVRQPVAPPTAASGMTMMLPRAAHTATALLDGRALIAGGCTTDGCGGTPAGGRTELFDPGRRAFVPGPTLATPRGGHTATALLDGRVLIVGGYPDEGRPPLASAEIVDRAATAVVPSGSMGTRRGAHTATRLADGTVLVVGGVDGNRALSSVERFDPRTGVFVRVADLPGPRAVHGAVLLRDGRVLVVGGQAGSSHGVALLDSALVYDPARDVWHEAGRLPAPTYKLAVAPLLDGGALVVGGQLADDRAARLASTAVFDPRTGSFRPGPTMSEPRYKISDAVVALGDGRLVVAGGFGVDLFAGGRFTQLVRDPAIERQSPAAVALPDGSVLVTGGYSDRTEITSSAVIVDPG